MWVMPVLLDLSEPDYSQFPDPDWSEAISVQMISVEDADAGVEASRLAGQARVQEEKDALDGTGPESFHDGHVVSTSGQPDF